MSELPNDPTTTATTATTITKEPSLPGLLLRRDPRKHKPRKRKPRKLTRPPSPTADLPHDPATETLKRRKRRMIQPPPPLVHSRAAASAMLGGCSTASLHRYEQMGLLKPLRLIGSPNGKVYSSDAALRELVARLETETD